MKSLKELLKGPSSWSVVEEIMQRATNRFEILPKTPANAEQALVGLQQSVKSLMGSITYETGGIFIDGGWLRILGSGHEKLTRTIATWNKGRSYDEDGDTAGFLMIADDVLGGIFAINGAELGEDIGNIYYLAPDTVDWEPMEVTYHEFLEFCFVGQVKEFYENLRWKGWEDEIMQISGDQTLMITPPLWAAEGPDDIAERNRLPLPVDEAYEMALDTNNMLYNEEDGNHEHECDCGDEDCDCDGEDCDCGHDHHHDHEK